MAIKTNVQGSIPAINLDHIQYSNFRMNVAEVPPHKISLSSVLRPYGVVNGEKFYSKDTIDMQIADLDVFIQNLPADKQTTAVLSMMKVQEGLGELAAAYLNIEFIGVE